MLTVNQGGQVLLSKRLNFVVPAEMETFSLELDQIQKNDDIIVNLEVL